MTAFDNGIKLVELGILAVMLEQKDNGKSQDLKRLN
jgi:hypothetical protein